MLVKKETYKSVYFCLLPKGFRIRKNDLNRYRKEMSRCYSILICEEMLSYCSLMVHLFQEKWHLRKRSLKSCNNSTSKSTI